MYTYVHSIDLLLSAIWKTIIIIIIIVIIITVCCPQIKSDQQLGVSPARPSIVILYIYMLYTYTCTYVLLYTYMCAIVPVR